MFDIFLTVSNNPGGLGGAVPMIIMVVVWIAVMYLLLFRPQKKQQAQQDQMMQSLKVGDSIMTTSGFYGTIIGIPDEDTVIVEFGNNKNCRIPMHKKAIAEVESQNAPAEEPEVKEEKKSKEDKKKK
jgi:preprotein translocase subunit YajC